MNMHTTSKSPVLPNSKSPVLPFDKRRNKMNSQIFSTRKWTNIRIGFVFVLLAALALSSCTSKTQREAFNKYMTERNSILQSRLLAGMTFEDVPLSTVLKEISKASGLTIKPWKDEGDRKVTIDVSGMTVDEALKAVVLYIDGEGAVVIEQKYFLHHSWGQYWLWGYPPSF
jgi:hypothetical protein